MKKQSVIVLVVVLVVLFLGGITVVIAGGLVWYAYQSKLVTDTIVLCDSNELGCTAVNSAADSRDNSNENVNVTNDSVVTTVDVNQSGYLKIDWSETPEELDISEYGFTVPPTDYTYESVDASNYYKVYQVGTIQSAPYAGQPLLIVQRTCDGPCGYSHYRVVDDRTESGGLVLLRTISNQLYEGDEQYFEISDEYDIAELHLPNQFTITDNGSEYRFKAEDFSPAVLFDEFTGDEYMGEFQSRFEHSLYGTLHEAMEGGYFMVRLPDGTNKIYRMELPFYFVDSSDSGWYRPVVNMLAFDDSGEVSVNAQYSPIEWATCPPRQFAYNRDISSNDLEQIGTYFNSEALRDDPIYRFKDRNHAKLHEKYDLIFEPEISYDEYVNNNPILFVQDAMGRWLELYNVQYQPLAEMGCFYINSVL